MLDHPAQIGGMATAAHLVQDHAGDAQSGSNA
jgi:hypothetical protein